MFVKNRNISSKIKRSKVTDYAALMDKMLLMSTRKLCFRAELRFNLIPHYVDFQFQLSVKVIVHLVFLWLLHSS